MSFKFCYTCINWEKVDNDANDSFGICHDVIVGMKVSVEKEDSTEEGELWTNGYFGCIYWRENDGSIVSFKDIIDEKGNPVEDSDDEDEDDV